MHGARIAIITTYDREAGLLFDAWRAAGAASSSGRRALLNQFIRAEKNHGGWQLTDDYWMLAAESAAQGLVSLKQRRTATATSTFAADGGYTSDGAATFINTGFIPTTHSVVGTAASCRIAVYERTNVGVITTMAAGSRGATATDATWIIPRNNADQIQGRAVSSTGSSATAVTDSRGFSATSRANTTSLAFYKNGAALAAATVSAGAALSETAVYINCYNINGTAGGFRASQVAFVCVSAFFTAAQELAQYNNVQAHMTAIGANV